RNSHLTITHDQPALIDPEHRTAELLDPETGAATQTIQLDLPADDEVVVSGSTDQARVLIVTGSRGELISCTFAGGCTAPVKLSSAGTDLGNPIEINNHAVVPDYSTGQATIVDLVGSRVVAQRQLFDRPARFELITHDGIIFFNDPNSNAAGVLDLTGDVRTVTKYAEGPAAGDVPPTPDPRTKADQVTKIDQRKQQQGLGLPGRTNSTTPPQPAPKPTASIVVRPGVQGVVGDEFELTMVLQPPSAAKVGWVFGDDTPAEGGITVRHRWQRPGTFTVRATATRDNGETVQSETAVTVAPAGTPPSIARLDIQRPRPVIGESVHFSADTTGQRPDSWRWTVTKPGTAAPEVTSDTAAFDHRFAATGVYTVSLTITSGAKTAQSTKQLTVSRGAVKVWGEDPNEVLREVPEAASNGVIAIDGGDRHCLALKADGSVIAWGDDRSGQTKVPANASSGVVAISAGGGHNLALKSDGSVIAWGSDSSDQSTVPPEALHDVIAIAAGGDHSLALKSDGSVVAWGSDVMDQIKVPDAAKSGVTAIATGNGSHSLALKSDGSVITWGRDAWVRTEVPPTAKSGVVGISVGSGRSLALKSDGSIIRWGAEWDGEIQPPSGPQRDIVSFNTNTDHTLALKADGSVIGWGPEGEGQTSLPPQYDHHVLDVATGTGFSMVIVDGLG
ncbi:PKD domain-containing protein, partial [Lentzea sp. NPDC006480]|uniref:PKD domain-containing protein n=1 Tax=Lentzea sp. NPDC006480 TaxID=3157176 RepID=UPI0033AE0B86